MKRALLLLLYLLWSLVEVQSQTEYPYVTFMGNILSNHSYVDLSQVGNDRTDSDSDTVQCHTDLSTCCRSSAGVHRGDWFAPGSDTRLPFNSEGSDIYEDRQAQVVHLRRRNNPNGPSGIYRCVIATLAVHNDSDQSVGGIIYVGLYGSGQGNIIIPDGISFTLDSYLNEPSPQFTLTCISTGGPATTVTWTRNSVTITEGNETVLDNYIISQYTHTLTVTGRLVGLYTCTVANNKPSESSAQLDVQVGKAPTNLMAVQAGPTSIRVSWTPPTPLGDTTGYRIYYSGGSSGSVDISGGSTDNYLLTGLQNGEMYTVSIMARSRHFSSESLTVMDIGLGLPIACSVSGVSDVKIECGGTPQTPLTCSFNQGPLHPCTLPLLLNSDVSPLGKHSVRIVANDSEATVSYSINDVSARVPPLGVYLINESPEIINDTVRVEFLTTRPVVGVKCFLKHDKILQEYSCSSGQASFLPILRDGPHELKIYAYNSKRDEVTVKREFVVTSDPNYCSLVLVNRGVVVSEDGTSAVVEVAVYGPATQLSCVLDGKTPFTCTSPVELSGLSEGKHKLKISPVGCSGGRKKLKVHFTT